MVTVAIEHASPQTPPSAGRADGPRALTCRRHSRGAILDPVLSIIIPTLNEAGNIAPLLERIRAALAGYRYEILVVDDGSRDGTCELCRKLERDHPVKLHQRSSPTAGLSGAVLFGFSKALGDILVVMDADLQHPPESILSLVAPLAAGEADFVIGSRHVKGAAIDSKWSILRRLGSWTARLLASPLSGAVRDPMSGFFALRRAAWQGASDLDPIGYKIVLELMCKCPASRVVEVPIRFASRQYGESKLGFREPLNYIRHLRKLYRYRSLRWRFGP